MESRIKKLLRFFRKFIALRDRLNRYMKEKWSANLLAGITTAICGILVIIMLFIPHYLGMGNDSIANEKMGYYKLDYLEGDMNPDDNVETNEYFIRVYELSNLDRGTEFSLESMLVRMAKALDWLFTKDRLFDIRFLAFLYTLLYLPGVYLILKAALERVQIFSEAVVLAVLGGMIFSDISYIAYFNSLYPDALFYIFLLYIAGCALLLHKEGKFQGMYLLLLGVSCIGFCLVSRRGYLAGIIMAFFFLMLLRYITNIWDRALNILVTCLVLGVVVVSFFQQNSEFDDIGKYHAMTRGVLLQSRNPSKTLERMKINVSYSVLTDDSLYEYYPVTQSANPLIQEEFLGNYSEGDIVLFYINHPGALISMWDLGIKAALNLQRDYCGNYERSTGMPSMSKSLFCSAWSIFKSQSAPKTVGYPLLLAVVIYVTSGRKLFGKRAHAQRWDYTYFMACTCLMVIGMADMTYVILHSGDAQLVQYNIILGTVLDILFYFVVAEILHKLDILGDESSENRA